MSSLTASLLLDRRYLRVHVGNFVNALANSIKSCSCFLCVSYAHCAALADCCSMTVAQRIARFRSCRALIIFEYPLSIAVCEQQDCEHLIGGNSKTTPLLTSARPQLLRWCQRKFVCSAIPRITSNF
ncbi:hypothetical protein KCP71_07855 [Salmonella enterica subsp. enterica]|nr:hypothetical protein KCP71_07855 [Salmonella enterica subsp. enterica]